MREDIENIFKSPAKTLGKLFIGYILIVAVFLPSMIDIISLYGIIPYRLLTARELFLLFFPFLTGALIAQSLKEQDSIAGIIYSTISLALIVSIAAYLKFLQPDNTVSTLFMPLIEKLTFVMDYALLIPYCTAMVLLAFIIVNLFFGGPEEEKSDRPILVTVSMLILILKISSGLMEIFLSAYRPYKFPVAPPFTGELHEILLDIFCFGVFYGYYFKSIICTLFKGLVEVSVLIWHYYFNNDSDE